MRVVRSCTLKVLADIVDRHLSLKEVLDLFQNPLPLFATNQSDVNNLSIDLDPCMWCSTISTPNCAAMRWSEDCTYTDFALKSWSASTWLGAFEDLHAYHWVFD